MNLAQYMERSAARVPEKIAVRHEGQSVTYRELNIRCNRLAAGLKQMGLATGDRCALMLPNSIHSITAYYAIAKLGAVVIPINYLYREHELNHIFSDSKPKAFIGARPYLSETIQTYIKKRVAPYKYPRIIHIDLQPLPKSVTGKILKKEIRKKFGNVQ